MEGNGGSLRIAPNALDGANRHICAFFNGMDEHYRVLQSFIKEGFDNGDKAFHLIDPERREDHLRRLADAGIDVDEAIDVGPARGASVGGRAAPRRAVRPGHMGCAGSRKCFGPGPRPDTRRPGSWHRWSGHSSTCRAIEDMIEFETRVNYVVPKYDDPVHLLLRSVEVQREHGDVRAANASGRDHRRSAAGESVLRGSRPASRASCASGDSPASAARWRTRCRSTSTPIHSACKAALRDSRCAVGDPGRVGRKGAGSSGGRARGLPGRSAAARVCIRAPERPRWRRSDRGHARQRVDELSRNGWKATSPRIPSGRAGGRSRRRRRAEPCRGIAIPIGVNGEGGLVAAREHAQRLSDCDRPACCCLSLRITPRLPSRTHASFRSGTEQKRSSERRATSSR